MASQFEGGDSALSFAERQGQLFAEGFSFSGYERDVLSMNIGGGEGFLDISGVSGADSVTDGRGSVFADFDNDGDLDIFLRAMHGPAHLLLRNNVGQDAPWLRVVLRGTASGPDAFGAVVRLTTSKGVRTKLSSGGAGFLGQSDARLLFGLGDGAVARSLVVRWPSGGEDRFDDLDVAAGQTLVLVEGEGEVSTSPLPTFALPDPPTEDELAWGVMTIDRGDALPPLDVITSDGKEPLADVLPPGRAVLLNFWATWCVPCRAEMPELEELDRRAGDDGVRVVGICLDDPLDRAVVDGVLDELGITYPVHGLGAAARRALFGEVQVPFSLLLDREHRAVQAFRGWSPEIGRRIEAATGR